MHCQVKEGGLFLYKPRVKQTHITQMDILTLLLARNIQKDGCVQFRVQLWEIIPMLSAGKYSMQDTQGRGLCSPPDQILLEENGQMCRYFAVELKDSDQLQDSVESEQKVDSDECPAYAFSVELKPPNTKYTFTTDLARWVKGMKQNESSPRGMGDTSALPRVMLLQSFLSSQTRDRVPNSQGSGADTTPF